MRWKVWPHGLAFNRVEVGGGQGVGEHAGDGVGVISSGGIFYAEFEERGGDAGVVLVGGDEWVEGGQLDLAGKCVISIRQLGERELAAEVGRFRSGAGRSGIRGEGPSRRC